MAWVVSATFWVCFVRNVSNQLEGGYVFGVNEYVFVPGCLKTSETND